MGEGGYCCCDSSSGEEESDDWDDSVCFDTFRGRDLQQANADPICIYDLKSIQGMGWAALLF